MKVGQKFQILCSIFQNSKYELFLKLFLNIINVNTLYLSDFWVNTKFNFIANILNLQHSALWLVR